MRYAACLSLIVLIGFATLSFAKSTDHDNKKLPIKVYLMAGQSNMVGHMSNKYVEENHPELMKPRNDVFCVRAGRISGPLKPGYGARENTSGMELVMGSVMGDAIENPIFFMKTCTGGTTLHKHWRPPSAVKRAGGEVGPLYTRMIGRFHNLLENMELHCPDAKNRDIEIAGFVWFQGENDCCGKDENGVGFWEYYEENLKDLMKDLRSDLGVPELPVLIVQINDSCWDGLPNRGGTVLRPIQRKVAEADPHATWFRTDDLNSGYHYDNASHITIGQRGGKAMLPFARKTVPQKKKDVAAARQRFLARQPKKGNPDTSSLASGLIGYWKFEEGTGLKTTDSSTAHNTGIVKGNAAWTDGRFGKAIELRTGQKIEIPDFKEPTGPSGNIENLSVAFWVRTNRYGDTRVGKGIGEKLEKIGDSNWFLSETANKAGWAVYAHDCDLCGFVTATFNNGPKTVMSDRPVHLVGDGVEWHHVAMCYNGKEKSLQIFVDGASLDPKRSLGSIKGIEDANHIIPADTALTLGGLIDRDGQFQIFDELGIWDRPITPEEVKMLYNNGFGAEIKLPGKKK